MRFFRWGDSLAVRIPDSVVEAPGLEGDEVEIHVAGARALGVARKAEREDLLGRLRAFRGRLPADFRFGRDVVGAVGLSLRL